MTNTILPFWRALVLTAVNTRKPLAVVAVSRRFVLRPRDRWRWSAGRSSIRSAAGRLGDDRTNRYHRSVCPAIVDDDDDGEDGPEQRNTRHRVVCEPPAFGVPLRFFFFFFSLRPFSLFWETRSRRGRHAIVRSRADPASPCRARSSAVPSPCAIPVKQTGQVYPPGYDHVRRRHGPRVVPSKVKNPANGTMGICLDTGTCRGYV